MKSIIKSIATILALCVLLSGCGGSETSSPGTQEKKPSSYDNSVSEKSSDAKSAQKMKTAMLYTKMGAEFESHPFEYSGDLTVEMLAGGLSQLTGLDYFLTETPASKPNEIIIDWSKNSTLIANLDDREQRKAFSFFDSDSMRWFMMDSLWRTLTENFNVENIYYTMDSGENLVFDELSPVKEFPADLPYMGEAFYSAHADVKGDEAISEEAAFELVKNTMKARGEKAPVIVKTGDETIEGEHAFIFSAGSNSTDGKKFTAMYHYAVSDSGKVYYMDILKGADWILFDTQAAGL